MPLHDALGINCKNVKKNSKKTLFASLWPFTIYTAVLSRACYYVHSLCRTWLLCKMHCAEPDYYVKYTVQNLITM